MTKSEYLKMENLNNNKELPNFHVGNLYYITQPCPFFEPVINKCRIYEQRPLMCISFPLSYSESFGITFGKSCKRFQDHIAIIKDNLTEKTEIAFLKDFAGDKPLQQMYSALKRLKINLALTFNELTKSQIQQIKKYLAVCEIKGKKVQQTLFSYSIDEFEKKFT